jgi:hypothetical protein
MVLPIVPTDELARRLQLTYPGGPLDTQLDTAIVVAVDMLTGHVTEALVAAHPASWAEAVTQLGVKLWDTGAKGMVAMDAAGEFILPAPSASPGMVNSVFGVLDPCMPVVLA